MRIGIATFFLFVVTALGQAQTLSFRNLHDGADHQLNYEVTFHGQGTKQNLDFKATFNLDVNLTRVSVNVFPANKHKCYPANLNWAVQQNEVTVTGTNCPMNDGDTFIAAFYFNEQQSSQAEATAMVEGR